MTRMIQAGSWETGLESWSERARSKPTRESVTQVKKLQQRHLYIGRGAAHLGCERFVLGKPVHGETTRATWSNREVRRNAGQHADPSENFGTAHEPSAVV